MKSLSLSVKEKADKIGNGIINAAGATSVQYAVSYMGEVILSGSVGKYDKEETRPLSKDDMYGIGSTSKTYATAAAMLLVDMGKLDIDKPYTDYVKDFEMADPRYKRITTRHLMNHSSGIYGTHFRGSFLLEDNNTFAHDNLIRHLKNCTLKYDPGTYMEYCNDGFQLLEILVERVSGKKYNEFLNSFFLEPLGAKNTKTPLDDYDRTQMVRCSMPPIYDGDLPYETTNVIGTGGLVSTCEDLCLFGQVLMGNKILSKNSAKLMGAKEYASGDFWVEDEEQDSIFAYGLGYDHVHLHPFDKVGVQALFKGGDSMVYHAAFVVIPDLDIAAGALSSGGLSLANCTLLIEVIKDICLEYGLVKQFPDEKTFTPPIKKEMPDEYLKYSGLYSSQEMNITVDFNDGQFEAPAMLKNLIPPQKYVYAGDGKFTGADGKHTVFFKEINDDLTFIQCDFNIELPGVGLFTWKSFKFQKLEKTPLDASVAAVWEKRQGKKYLLVDEFPNSGLFLDLSTQYTQLELKVSTEYGYVNGAKIIDENFAKNALLARDIVDYQFYTETGVEYLIARNQHHIEVDAIKELDPHVDCVTIDANGFIKYYVIGGSTAGKTISVELPEAAVFAAYGEKLADAEDAPRALKSLTSVTGNNPVELEAGDLLAFIGYPGDVFNITIG